MKLATLMLLAAHLAWCASGPERYALVLSEPPLARQIQSRQDLVESSKSPRRAALQASEKSLSDDQARVRQALADLKVGVIGANHTLANVIFVNASRDEVAALSAIPGVALVQKLQPIKLHLNQAAELMNVPRAWGVIGGDQNAGSGIKIGILDTGIDHTHPAFRDDGLQFPAGFPKCLESRGDCAYTNRKVIVARSYVNLLVGTEPRTSRPDDLSPRDRSGHGTAVAMIAAGARVTGPSATITGVAPKAWLGNYKVFGSPGVNGAYTYDAPILQAIEDAMRDGMDVLSISLGTPATWGPRDTGGDCNLSGTAACDWRTEAVEHAVRLGMTVVVSAGNDGSEATRFPALNSVHSPGTAPSAITVGATTNRHIWYQSLRVEGSNVPTELRAVRGLFGDGPRPNPSLNAPLRDVANLGNDGKACTALPNDSLAGTIAVIARFDCTLRQKIDTAARAGAVGVIVYQTDANAGIFSPSGLQETSIPMMLIDNASAERLRNYLRQNTDARATLDPALRETSTTEFDTISVISSRGPSLFRVDRPTAENGIKPEVVAVGTDLYVATQRYDPNGSMHDPSGFTTTNGTSFAAPFASGVAALVKQRNPRFTPAQIKSAVVNTANADAFILDSNNRLISAGVVEAGAGKLDAHNAVRTNVTAEPSTLWFGAMTGGQVVRSFKLTNHSNSSMRLTLSVDSYDSADPRLTISPNNPNIAAGGSVDVRVTYDGPRPGPGIYEGWIVVQGGAVPLQIPYMYVVGDGVPYTILPLRGSFFEGTTGGPVTLMFKVTDRFGVPVPNVAVRTVSTLGGGSVFAESKFTDMLGIGYAEVDLGNQQGEQEYYVAIGDTTANFGIYFVGWARVRPSIASGGIVNAASGRLDGGIAPGSYISIYGTGLSDSTRVYSTPYLPLALAGVSVSFDVPSQNLSVPARLHFVRDNQINVQVPWELQGVPSAEIKVSMGDVSSALVTVPVRDQSPGIFEYSESTGRSLAAARDINFAVIGSSNPARRGNVIQLYVNGLGPVTNQPPSGEPAPADPLARTRSQPSVKIGGVDAEVSFSGLAPGNVSLYQINVRVPATAPTGFQPVVISINGTESKAATLPVE